MTIQDALGILELQSGFTKAELGKAYRHALMVWHPDRFSGNEELIKKAQERTRGIIEAFELLFSLATSDSDAGTDKQEENAAPVREPGAQDKQRPSGTVPLPQADRLSTTGKKGRGSSDKATWIITGVSVIVAIVLISALSKHSPKIKGEPPNVEPPTKVESVVSATPLPVVESPKPSTADSNGSSNGDSTLLKELRDKAEQGDAEAQNKLGYFYTNGQGVPKDEPEALKWYGKAAEQGDAYGQYNSALCYANGEGVQKDEVEALKWYRKSAEQGMAVAQQSLGYMYVVGQGAPKDEVEAAKWYRKAAEQGDAVSQYNLGVLYAQGKIGLHPRSIKGSALIHDFINHQEYNYVEAHVWLNLAGANGHENARKLVTKIESEMSRDEITEATAKAKELFEKLKAKEKK